jgi:hypothetical protein
MSEYYDLVKVNFDQEQPMKAQRGVEVYLYSFFSLDARWGEWLTPRPGRFTPGKETRYQFCKRLGGLQNLSGQVWKI